MRLLYLYSEEWTGKRAREVHTLSTCVALAQAGVKVTLVTAGGQAELRDHLHDIADGDGVPGLDLVVLSRALGPIRSTAIFSRNFNAWVRTVPNFDFGYIIHLKAGPILRDAGIPYAYEAHEIFAQSAGNPVRQRKLHELEGSVLEQATKLIATSAPLATALGTWFSINKDFTIVPNAGQPPLAHSVCDPEGPYVYCGSIMDWKGLDAAILAAKEVQAPLRIIGGTVEDWRALAEKVDCSGVEWRMRVTLREVPEALVGARAGLVPTNFDMPAGEFSCPMKLFDYARCGLPVLTTALPALQSLYVGKWCTEVPSPSTGSWIDAFKQFEYDPTAGDEARKWSEDHTWEVRAAQIMRALNAA
jgi:glycosyltransferase involved in cell wall biosynthesis